MFIVTAYIFNTCMKFVLHAPLLHYNFDCLHCVDCVGKDLFFISKYFTSLYKINMKIPTGYWQFFALF